MGNICHPWLVTKRVAKSSAPNLVIKILKHGLRKIETPLKKRGEREKKRAFF